MRRITTLLAAMLLALGLTAGPAIAMQPPGEGAQDNFGCEDGEVGGETDPIGGHPGSYNSGDSVGLDAATAKLMEKEDNPTSGHPTAWNAVEHTGGHGGGPIYIGECSGDDD